MPQSPDPQNRAGEIPIWNRAHGLPGFLRSNQLPTSSLEPAPHYADKRGPLPRAVGGHGPEGSPTADPPGGPDDFSVLVDRGITDEPAGIKAMRLVGPFRAALIRFGGQIPGSVPTPSSGQEMADEVPEPESRCLQKGLWLVGAVANFWQGLSGGLRWLSRGFCLSQGPRFCASSGIFR